MRPQAPEQQASGTCSCAQNLANVAQLLRMALELIEGTPISYEQGVANWHATVQAHQQRTQHPVRGERHGG